MGGSIDRNASRVGANDELPAETLKHQPWLAEGAVSPEQGKSPPARRDVHDPTSTEPVVRGRTRLVYWVLVVLWGGANLAFWTIWFRPDNVATPWLFVIFTAALGYDATILPSIYLYYLGRMRRPRPVAAPPGRKVALITLCVPSSESIQVIADQLAAISAVRYPHDSWILDEGNDRMVREVAARLGVRYFTRAGIPRYNQPNPPFAAKMKAGNVNAWLDAWGQDYEFFAQFDVDHHPVPEYLDRVLGYFADPRVAWVQAPSLYKNFDTWIARGAAEQELVLQGPLQQGFYGSTETPFIIGSHSTYRMSAIREIGGFQPTRAEDHLDTVVLALRGYHGVFVPEQIALGDGPESFDTYLRQQFAWAYSMMQVLFSYAPRYLRELPLPQARQFLWVQTWYPLWSASLLTLYLMPAIVLLTGVRPTLISFAVFVLATLPMTILSFVVYFWSRRWQLPVGLRLSWRGVLLHVARWPIVAWALINVLLGISHPYMITPKGAGRGPAGLSLLSQSPYLGLAALNVVASWAYTLQSGCPECRPYVAFAGIGVLWMLAVVVANVWVGAVDQPGAGLLRRLAHPRSAPLLAAALAILALQLALVATYPKEGLARWLALP